jgi:hypothetical protein
MSDGGSDNVWLLFAIAGLFVAAGGTAAAGIIRRR